MTAYRIDLLLTKDQFRLLVEQANTDGKSLEAVAATLIGGSLEKLALKRVEEFHRGAEIILDVLGPGAPDNDWYTPPHYVLLRL